MPPDYLVGVLWPVTRTGLFDQPASNGVPSGRFRRKAWYVYLMLAQIIRVTWRIPAFP